VGTERELCASHTSGTASMSMRTNVALDAYFSDSKAKNGAIE
jgi:hypothetical protein